MAFTSRYYTFGADHTLPGVDDATGWHVRVDLDDESEVDARALILAWLGGFAAEYYPLDWYHGAMCDRTRCAYVVSVDRACPDCEEPQRSCLCLVPEPPMVSEEWDRTRCDGDGCDREVTVNEVLPDWCPVLCPECDWSGNIGDEWPFFVPSDADAPFDDGAWEGVDV